MPLVPPDSPLRLVPDSLDRRSVLFLDGIRYSIHIFDLSLTRLIAALKVLSTDPEVARNATDQIASAISDAWAMIDSVHRLRELLSQAPGLKKTEPELQVFLRGTLEVEKLRHFYQHFRNEIDSFASVGMPLWGTLSWIHTDLATGENSNFTIVPGTFFSGATVYSCTIDTVERKYVQRIAFYAGAAMIDLAVLAERIERFVSWYSNWYQQKYPDISHHPADALLSMTVRMRLGPAPDQQT